MRSNDVKYGNDSREKVLMGITALSNAVEVTLGPKGRNAIIDRDDDVIVVNDGITIANSLRYSDRYMDMGARLAIQSASKTNEKSGDGTTTSIILTSELCKKGNDLVCDGANPVELRRGMEYALGFIKKHIIDNSIEIKNDKSYLKSVATVSSGRGDLGKIVADAYEAVNFNGIVTFEESKSNKTFIEVVDGMRFDSGYMSPYFINQPQKKECVLENPYILISDMKLYNVDEIYPLLEQVCKESRSLLIIADDVDGLALSTIIKNVLAGNLNCCCVKAPYYGEVRETLLKDIGLFTKGRNFSEKLSDDFKLLSMDDVGEARRVVVTDTDCTITTDVDPSDELINEIKLLESQIANFDVDDKITDEKKTLEERVARLNGKVAIVKVGGSTEVEMNESKLRVEDAINAVRASIESGIVVGEGRTYIDAYHNCIIEYPINITLDFIYGAKLVEDILDIPFRRIFLNAGYSDSQIDDIISKLNRCKHVDGFSVSDLSYIDNLYDEGIIDPVSVSVGALENAVSVASMFITTEVAITFDGKVDVYNPMI